ncbi:ABC transporter substrate-binding protein [Allonocardiopsis opalescens]|uniref:Peptide/nickel transport system substrate-binding protein n=1 Tax=Allonocardiopsis opalescens TaxID=1144618 RepID=A0A2T0QAQ5_9ACTN|nr:ABC transporter substrate-binding protein [Allonocardiopsis opalescens]PRY00891.1 peptide/nickel transport system substrate-binding protein [Allonocardiopsis opalescens]
MDTGTPTRGRRRPRTRALGAVAGVLVLALTGCSFFSTDPAGQEEGAAVEGVNEAPMLAERVEAGELPPLAERLPEDPVVVQPTEQVGTYGGEWNSAIAGVGDWPWLGRTVGYESLTRWSTDWTETIPNLAESWEYNEDATQLTYTLRAGLRWSDGEPFTSRDIEFALNDIFGNEEVSPEAITDPGTVEVVDDQTFTITWEEPRALFAASDLLNYQIVNKPRHYLEQFHEDYNPDAQELAEEEGFDSWVEMLDVRAGVTNSALTWQNPELPTMNPWMVVEPLADSGTMVLERNPYYWKIDTEGNQLPYIDRVNFEIMQDPEVMLTRALNGDINMHSRHFNTLANRPVLAENRERGNYDFFAQTPSEMNTNVIAFNLTHEDESLREVFNDIDFRIAMSHAINRQEVIDVVYQEQGEPWQAAPRRESPYYNEELATQYLEYDPELAEQILDDAGYERRGGDGPRLGPDGEPIAFTLSVATDFRPDQIDAMEMVVGYWQAVGIDVQLRPEDRALFLERKQNNEHEVSVWSGDSGLTDVLYDPRWYVPWHSGESAFAIPWAQWYASEGQDERGQEPSEPARQQLELYDQVQAEPDPAAQQELMRQIIDIAQDQFWAMGIGLTPETYGIVANDFHNVPERMFSASNYNDPGPTNPEQYYVEQP